MGHQFKHFAARHGVSVLLWTSLIAASAKAQPPAATPNSASDTSAVTQASTPSNPSPKNTDTTPGALSRALWYGPSAGTPTAAKTITVFTLYGIAVGGAAVGGYFLNETFAARNATDRFLDRTPAACVDFTADSCRDLVALRDEENTQSHRALLGAAGAGLFLVTGLLTALLWENDSPKTAVPVAFSPMPWLPPAGMPARAAQVTGLVLRSSF